MSMQQNVQLEAPKRVRHGDIFHGAPMAQKRVRRHEMSPKEKPWRIGCAIGVFLMTGSWRK
jgi:hypothetical protein